MRRPTNQPKPPWKIHAIGMGILIFASVPIYLFGLAPARLLNQKNAEKTTLLTAKLDDVHRLRKEYRAVSASVSAAQPTEQSVTIPTSARDAEFLGDVAAVAAELGIVIDDYQRGEAKQFAGFSALSVNLKFQCDHFTLCKFFDQVSELPYLAQVSSLQVEVREMSDKLKSAQTQNYIDEAYPVDVEFMLYFQPNSAPANPELAAK